MSLVEVDHNTTIKREQCETIKEEIPTDIGRIDEIIIKPEPLLENEHYGNVIKTEKDDKQIFTCVQCSEFFEYMELYELHISIHNQISTEMKYCPCCKKQYKSTEKYISHIQEHLEKHRRCPFCNQIFFNQNRLKVHVLEHKKNGALTCSYCGKVFTIQKSLTMHIRVHTNERPYECDKCFKCFKQISSLRTHKELIHSEGNPQECEVCHGKFCTKSSLKRHMKLHNTGRTITCKSCAQNFLNKELYKTHRMEKHIKLSAFFEICPECNEEFFTYREYYYHMKVHISNEKMKEKKKRFRYELDVLTDDTKLSPNENIEICWLCGEKVLSKLLTEHKNKHLLMTSEELLESAVSKKFQCKLCKNVVSTKKSLLGHMDSHMEKAFACDKDCCTPYLFSYHGLKRHERRFHALIKEPIKLRTCFLCGLDMKNIDYDHHLNAHLQMTDDEILQCKLAKEYQCKQCSIIVPTKSLLLKHTMSHVPKKYTCQELNCNRTLYTYIGLRSHQRSVHDEFTCKHCTKTFMGFQKFRAHHHKSDYTLNKFSKKIFKCSWCSAKFSNPMAITHHYRTHKTSDFRCRICDRRYPGAGDIKNHMFKVHHQRFSMEDCYRYLVNKVDHTATEETFVCTWCKVGFSTQKALTKHEQIHTDNRYQCKKCKNCFTDFAKYANHIKTYVCVRWMVEALIPEAKDLKCMYCNDSFSEYFDSTKHITNFHLKELYRCKFCDSNYPIESLRPHLLKRHSRRRKYLCVGCKASFVTFKAYLQHRKRCAACPLLYRDRSKRPINEKHIVIDVDGIQEDIVDVPEKVAVNEFGDIIVPENGDTVLDLSAIDVD